MVVKPFYTTGEIAKRFDVANRTVAKLFDEGNLKGFKIHNDRRISRESVISYFGDKLRIPCDELRANIVLVGSNKEVARYLDNGNKRLFIEHREDLFSMGSIAQSAFVIIMDFSLGRTDCLNAAKNYRGDGYLIGIPSDDEQLSNEDLRKIGFDFVYRRPYNLSKISAQMNELYQGIER